MGIERLNSSRSGQLSIALAGLLLLATPAHAQTTGQDVEVDIPEAIDDADIDGLNAGLFELKLDAHAEYSDNFYYEPSNERTVTGAVISPTFNYIRNGRNVHFGANGGATGGVYSFGNEDNFVDYRLGARSTWSLAQEQRFALNANFRHEHDPFGQDRTEGTSRADRELDEWDEASVGAHYSKIQAAGAGFLFGLGGRFVSRDYTTNRTNTRFLDYSRAAGDLSIGWRFSPKTAMHLEYTRVRSEIEEIAPGQPDRSGDADVLLLGVSWLASAKTRGVIKVGSGRRSPDDPNLDSFRSGYWSAGVSWNPVSRTTVTLNTVRSYIESYRLSASFVDATGSSLSWRQNWNSRMSTRLAVSYRTLDFIGTPDDDEYLRTAGRLSYLIGSGSTVYLGATHNNRESTRRGLEFDRTRAVLGLETVLN